MNAHLNGIKARVVEILPGKKYRVRALSGVHERKLLQVQHQLLRLAPATLPESPEAGP